MTSCDNTALRKPRFSRWATLFISTCGAAYLSNSGRWHQVPSLIYNPSASAPLGWYHVSPAAHIKVDDYVLVSLSLGPKRLAAERGYLPETVPLVKRVGAIADQFICVRGRSLWIDGELAATALTHDGQGRELPRWHDCRVLLTDELLLLSRDNSASFDSRYFGPIRIGQVIGKASPLGVSP
jgi:conjugative transfer signal peptidase TraF